MTVEWLHAHGRQARPCRCDYEACEGWQMVNAAEYDADLAAWREGGVPHP